MSDPFMTAAGPAPAPPGDARWRQVALLSASRAIAGNDRAGPGLAATLLALDHPVAAIEVLAREPEGDPWTTWWRTLAVGQSGDLLGLTIALDAPRPGPDGPDGREVARRLDDLAAEVAALGGDVEADARFAVAGHRARPTRRMRAVGRSSAAFLLEPGWDAARLVRLAPSEGPRSGNRAHLTLAELIAAMRRGDAGPGRPVPDDEPPPLDPQDMLDALREDRAVRDRSLLDLADEVREERQRLREERALLQEERDEVRARLRRAEPVASSALVPVTPADASRLLGVSAGAPAREVERAYRSAIVRCHPDRVAELHPEIRDRAQQLTVALNAARDLLVGAAPVRRRRAAR